MQTYFSSFGYLSQVYGRPGERPNLLRVLTYHRVGKPDEFPYLDPRQVSATPEMFEQQMRFLAAHYQVVHMEQVAEAAANGTRLPRNAVAITFDDAYRDVQDYAWPILKRYKLPATVFVPTAYPDQPQRTFWWDRLYNAFFNSPLTELPSSPIGTLSLKTPQERLQNLKRLQNYLKSLSHNECMGVIDETCRYLNGKSRDRSAVMGWEALRRLAKEGLTPGGHTRTHPILTRIPLPEVRREVRGCLEDLKREIGEVLPVFAYPNGNHNEEILQIMKKEGYQLAFITRGGFNNLEVQNPLTLQRINITRRTDLRIFRLRLQRWFSYIDMKRSA